MTPLIFDIKRYAINDGPGIRITIFMKGCPLSCKWCHNPESQSPAIQKFYTASKCIGAKDCIEICPNNALNLTPHGIETDFETCQLCGKCADACPAKAIEMSGEKYDVAKIIKIIERERILFDQSDGGVTISGGEPLMYPDFLIELLKACGEANIHRTVDTSGFSETKTILNVAKYTDLFLYDLKMMDSKKHKNWTGVDNKLILENLEALAKTNVHLNIRIPLIRNVNTDVAELTEMAKFIAELPGEKPQINFLPYHNIATNKYAKLGLEYKEFDMAEPSDEELNRAISIFENFGMEVEIGG
jgi:pyruvate formate lyase activating enzyme